INLYKNHSKVKKLTPGLFRGLIDVYTFFSKKENQKTCFLDEIKKIQKSREVLNLLRTKIKSFRESNYSKVLAILPSRTSLKWRSPWELLGEHHKKALWERTILNYFIKLYQNYQNQKWFEVDKNLQNIYSLLINLSKKKGRQEAILLEEEYFQSYPRKLMFWIYLILLIGLFPFLNSLIPEKLFSFGEILLVLGVIFHFFDLYLRFQIRSLPPFLNGYEYCSVTSFSVILLAMLESYYFYPELKKLYLFGGLCIGVFFLWIGESLFLQGDPFGVATPDLKNPYFLAAKGWGISLATGGLSLLYFPAFYACCAKTSAKEKEKNLAFRNSEHFQLVVILLLSVTFLATCLWNFWLSGTFLTKDYLEKLLFVLLVYFTSLYWWLETKNISQTFASLGIMLGSIGGIFLWFFLLTKNGYIHPFGNFMLDTDTVFYGYTALIFVTGIMMYFQNKRSE
ncbi:MAG: hypothetical protein D6785_14475, partial [Planctomycetota bacterium]